MGSGVESDNLAPVTQKKSRIQSFLPFPEQLRESRIMSSVTQMVISYICSLVRNNWIFFALLLCTANPVKTGVMV